MMVLLTRVLILGVNLEVRERESVGYKADTQRYLAITLIGAMQVVYLTYSFVHIQLPTRMLTGCRNHNHFHPADGGQRC